MSTSGEDEKWLELGSFIERRAKSLAAMGTVSEEAAAGAITLSIIDKVRSDKTKHDARSSNDEDRSKIADYLKGLNGNLSDDMDTGDICVAAGVRHNLGNALVARRTLNRLRMEMYLDAPQPPPAPAPEAEKKA